MAAHRESAVPSESDAASALARWHQAPLVSLQRFSTGNHHYVYDALFADGTTAVARLARPADREALAGALHWNGALRPLGIPLPEILYSDLEAEFPILILERLRGVDLGFVIDHLSEGQTRRISAQLMAMQRVVGALPSGGRYGYAVSPALAPYGSWVECLRNCVNRSRTRIKDAAIVNPALVERVARALEPLAGHWQTVPGTPFLHDITTKNVIVNDGSLSGIVDVDDLCYGDPLFQIALTRMALLSQGSNLAYIDQLLDSYGGCLPQVLNLYTAIFCLDFLSELGQPLNGNPLDGSPRRKAYLEEILVSLLD